VLNENLPPGIRVRTGAILTEAITALATAPTTVPSFFTEGDPLDQEAREYLRALIAADRARARALVMALVEQDTPLRDIYLHLIQPVLYEVGRLWQVQQITVAQEHYVTAATQQILAQLYLPVAREVKRANRRGRTLVAACAGYELHEVGIRMVADFFEMDGWDTYYTGANTPVESIVKMVADERASAVALSLTMCYHIPHLHRLILSLRDDRETASVKILVGGYPFNLVHGLWQKIGADAYATSAQDAVRAVNRMMDEEGLNRHAPR
jgi:methanogenic corrinoid protein MtbC1